MPALFIFNLVQLLLLYLACLCSCACLLSSIEQSRSEQEKVKHFGASWFLISDSLRTIYQESCRHPKQVLLIPFVVHDTIFECILLNICYMCSWKICLFLSKAKHNVCYSHGLFIFKIPMVLWNQFWIWKPESMCIAAIMELSIVKLYTWHMAGACLNATRGVRNQAMLLIGNQHCSATGQRYGFAMSLWLSH